VGSGEKFHLAGSTFRIGRDPECSLRVFDPHVSRAHAEIRREGGEWILYDLSTNGTWVNAQRVQERQALRHGDMIRIASESFVFMIGAETEEAPGPAGAIPLPEPPRPRERTGRTDPSEQTAFLRSRSRRAVPWWAYVAGAAVAAAALYFLLVYFLTS
jgi:pSer/pThr/pTyr-binding forkhead associated (FHA) protein